MKNKKLFDHQRDGWGLEKFTQATLFNMPKRHLEVQLRASTQCTLVHLRSGGFARWANGKQ